jgi:hypothetical protein
MLSPSIVKQCKKNSLVFSTICTLLSYCHNLSAILFCHNKLYSFTRHVLVLSVLSVKTRKGRKKTQYHNSVDTRNFGRFVPEEYGGILFWYRQCFHESHSYKMQSYCLLNQLVHIVTIQF